MADVAKLKKTQYRYLTHQTILAICVVTLILMLLSVYWYPMPTYGLLHDPEAFAISGIFALLTSVPAAIATAITCKYYLKGPTQNTAPRN